MSQDNKFDKQVALRYLVLKANSMIFSFVVTPKLEDKVKLIFLFHLTAQ